MKTKLLILFTIVFLAVCAQADPLGYVVSGGVWTDDGFAKAGGGFLTGFVVPVDANRGLYMRTLYHQFNIGDDKPVQSIEAAMILTYGLGKNYSLYFHVGGEEYMSGAEGTQFIAGMGTDKTIWSIARDGYDSPYTFKLFADVSFVDNEFQPTGQHFKFFGGIIFYPPQK